jgi:hypothetical protein
VVDIPVSLCKDVVLDDGVIGLLEDVPYGTLGDGDPRDMLLERTLSLCSRVILGGGGVKRARRPLLLS